MHKQAIQATLVILQFYIQLLSRPHERHKSSSGGPKSWVEEFGESALAAGDLLAASSSKLQLSIRRRKPASLEPSRELSDAAFGCTRSAPN